MAIKSLLGKVSLEKRDWLFGLVTSWFKAKKVSVAFGHILAFVHSLHQNTCQGLC